jgi:hypothetical protein
VVREQINAKGEYRPVVVTAWEQRRAAYRRERWCEFVEKRSVWIAARVFNCR